MRRLLFLLIGTTFLFSGCAVHNGLMTNANLNTTEVVLARNNFKVLASVQGESQAIFIFGIGGLTKNAMIAEARSQMLSKANIIGSSKAIINETVEIKHSIFPVVRVYTVMVTGHIVEFTE